MNTIYSAVDVDGDSIRVTDEESDGVSVTVKEPKLPAACS